MGGEGDADGHGVGGFAGAARGEDGDEPFVAEEAGEFVDLAFAADQFVQLRWEVVAQHIE